MKRPDIREIDHTGPRVESGPTRIGDDWTGLFLRGDDCLLGLAPHLSHAAVLLREFLTEYRCDATFFDHHALSTLESLIDQLNSVDEHGNRPEGATDGSDESG